MRNKVIQAVLKKISVAPYNTNDRQQIVIPIVISTNEIRIISFKLPCENFSIRTMMTYNIKSSCLLSNDKKRQINHSHLKDIKEVRKTRIAKL